MAATLDLVIRAQNQAGAALNQLQRQLGGINKEAGFAQRGMSGLQRVVGGGLALAAGAATGALIGTGVAVTALATDGVRMAADLEAQISSIAAVMGETKDAVVPLKDLILDLGLDPNLKVDAQEAADAIEMLARNGLSMTEIMDGAARSTVLLANATGAQFGTAADIATDVMAQFKIAATDMDTAVNGITSVVTNSKFSIDDYGLAIAQAGGVAGSVGVEFDDFNTSIAAMSPLFASGSDAGTSFKTFLQRLAPDTKPAREAMAEIGLLTEEGTSKFFDANGSLRDMSEVSVLLSNSLSGLSEQQRNSALQAIFGTDAMRAAVGLMESGTVVYTDAAEAAAALGVSQEQVNKYIEGGITQFEALQMTMSKTDAAAAAAVRMDNLRGAMEILAGVVDTLKIQIGDAFIPVIRRMTEAATVFLETHGSAFVGFFRELIDVIEISVDDGWGWLDWLVTIGVRLGFAQQQMLAMATSIENMTTAIRDMLAPWVSWRDVLIAVGVVVASIVLPALGAMVAAAAPVIAVFAAIVAAVALLRNAWERDWGGIRGITENVLSAISTAVSAVWTAIATGDTTQLNTLWESVKTWIAGVAEELPTQLATWVTEFSGWASDVWTDLSTNLNAMWTSLTTWIDGKVDVLYPYLYKWATEFWAWAGEVWAELGPTLGTVWNSLQNWVTLKGLELKNKITEWGDSFLEFPQGMVDAVAILQSEWDEITPIIENHVQRFKDAFASLQESLGPLQDAFGRLFEALQPWFVGLGVTVGVVFLAIGAAISALLVFISSLVAEIGVIFATLVDGLATQVEAANQIIGGLVSFATALIQGDWAAAWESAKQIVAGFALSIGGVFTMLWGVTVSIFNIIKNTVVGILTDMGVDAQGAILAMRTAIRMSFFTMKTNIESTVSAIKTAVLIDFALMKLRMEGAIGDAVSAVTGKFNELKTGAATAIDNLRATVEEKFNGIKTWIGGLSIPNPFAGVIQAAQDAVNAVSSAWNSITGSGGGGGAARNAAGTDFFRGGMTTLNERGTELIALPGRNRQAWLPRGSAIIPAEQSMMMGGGGVTVNVYATVSNGMDAESLAYQIAGILRRNQR